ncbi:MAG: serine hydrolase [Eubacteriales bacterium]
MKIKTILICLVISFSLATVFSSCVKLKDIRPKTSSEISSLGESPASQPSHSESEIPAVGSAEIPSICEESSAVSEVSEDAPAPAEYSYKGYNIKGFTTLQADGLLDQISAVLNGAKADFGIYYEELTTGYSISFNADTKFCSASVIKAPYAMYLMTSGVDLNQTLTLSSSQKMDGSGVLRNNPSGSKYTIEKLIEYSITQSDNTAYRMLYDNFDFGDFNRYTFRLGIDTSCSSSSHLGYLGFMTAFEAGMFFKDIYIKSQSSDNVKRLLEYLKNTSYSYLLPGGITEYSVAHKYGYMTGAYKVLHDAGIVLAPKPYVIAIMTNFNPSGGNGRSAFQNISSYINTFHNSLES